MDQGSRALDKGSVEELLGLKVLREWVGPTLDQGGMLIRSGQWLSRWRSGGSGGAYRCLVWLPPRVLASARRQKVSACLRALSWLEETKTRPVDPLLTATRVSWQTLTLFGPLYSSPITGPGTHTHTHPNKHKQKNTSKNRNTLRLVLRATHWNLSELTAERFNS